MSALSMSIGFCPWKLNLWLQKCNQREDQRAKCCYFYCRCIPVPDIPCSQIIHIGFGPEKTYWSIPTTETCKATGRQQNTAVETFKGAFILIKLRGTETPSTV